MNQKGNKKSQNTKKRIVEALLQLLRNNVYSEITITEICQCAEIGRASFYRNFKQKEDIVRYAVDEVLKTLFQDVDDFSILINSGEKFYQTFIKEKEFFQFLFEHDLYIYLLQSLFAYLSEKITGIDVKANPFYIQTNKKEEINDYYSMGVMAYTIMGILDVWLSRDCKEDEEVLHAILTEMDTYSFHKRGDL